MNLYGEAVLFGEFGKIPDDARRVNVPRWVTRHFGEVYRVGEVDAALLRGAYAEAQELVEKDKKNRFNKITKNGESYCSPSFEREVIREVVESELKGKYTRGASGLRELCGFFEQRNTIRFVT